MSDPTAFVACAPGLEAMLALELDALGVVVERSIPGGVEFVGGPDDLARVAVGCGLGLRILVRIAAFMARDFARLERELQRIDWALHVPRGDRLDVRVVARRSRLYHTKAIAERVERALSKLSGEGPTSTLHVRVEHDRFELSIDACGEPLHKRGWRLESGKAPLREDVARALLDLAGFESGSALLDPASGSGTLVIEAATMAARLPPGIGRSFACERWPGFDVGAFDRARGRVESSAHVGPVRLIGRDRNEGAIAIARANAERAHVAERTHFEVASIGDRTLTLPEGPLVLVGNLPWGQRVGDPARLRNLYASFGALARRVADDHPLRIGLVTPDRMLAGATGLGLEARVWTDQGGTRIGLWTATLE